MLEARGDPWDMWSASPPSEVITVDELKARLEQESTTQPSPTAQLFTSTEVVLDLLDPSIDPTQASINDFVATIAAFYTPSTGRVTIIDRGEPATADQLKQNTILLAHELTHYVQDRDSGLSRFEAGADSDDTFFARRSLVEGEADLYMEVFSFRVQGRDYDTYDWGSWYDDMLTAYTSDVGSAANRLDSGLSLYLYPVGGRRATAAYVAGGNLAVRALWSAPPQSTLAMVTPYGTTAPATEDYFTCLDPSVPPLTTLSVQDRLGAMALYILAADRWMPAADAWALVPSWRNDTLWAFATRSGTVAVWRFRFAAGTDLTALATAIEGTPSTHDVRVEVSDPQLTLVATDVVGLLDSWTGWRCNP